MKPIVLSGDIIVFDCGNTLVFDPFDDLKDNTAKKASELSSLNFNFNLDQNLFLDAWSKANRDLHYQFASHFSQEEPFIQAGLAGANVPAEIRALLAPQILTYYRQSFKKLLESDPRKKELRETLEELHNRGKHLSVIANDRRFTPKSTLTWLGVADLFDHFLTSEELGVEKPDPKVFMIAAKILGVQASDVIYVGDDPIRDVQCAHKAGAKAILYVPPERFRSSNSWRGYSNVSDKPDAVISDFRELLKIISK